MCSSFPNGYFGGIFLFIPLSAAFCNLPKAAVYAWSIFLKLILVKCEHTIYLHLVLRPENTWSLGSMLYILLEYLEYPFFLHIFLVICMSSKPSLTLHIQEMREIILYYDASWSHANGSWDALKEVLSHISKKFLYSICFKTTSVCFPS